MTRQKTQFGTMVRSPAKEAEAAAASTNPADWQSAILGIGTEFAKVAADNLKRQNQVDTQQQRTAEPFNWKPWAIGGAAGLVGLIVLMKVLK
jgi:hypothetical protein